MLQVFEYNWEVLSIYREFVTFIYGKISRPTQLPQSVNEQKTLWINDSKKSVDDDVDTVHQIMVICVEIADAVSGLGGRAAETKSETFNDDRWLGVIV